MPDWVERPPLVEMERPPVKVEVPAFNPLIRPENRASPVEMLSPWEEARPAEERPPVNVEVPDPATVMRSATEKEVVEAMGKVEDWVVLVMLIVPVTCSPQAKTESPAD